MTRPDAEAPTMPETAVVEHRIPGRMRLRVRNRRGDAAFFRRIEAGIAGVAGVTRVQTNAVTAGILVEHQSDEAAILSSARERGLFAAEPQRQDVAIRTHMSSGPARRPASVANLASAGLVAAGLLQLARGQVVGSASENLWNAYGLYALTRQPAPAAVLVGFGLLQLVRGEVLGSAISLFLYAYSARRLAHERLVEEDALE